jgi:hypothetical protein
MAGSTVDAVSAPEPLSFDEAVGLLRRRLRDADHLSDEMHNFSELMSDYADVLPDHFYLEAFEELQALGHLHQASSLAMGPVARGRLSADGRAYLRWQDAGGDVE